MSSRTIRALTSTILAAVLLGACAPDSPDTRDDVEGASIDATVQQAARDAGIQDCPPERPGNDGRLADIEVVCVSTGQPATLADFDGPTVVNVWAHWCEPCRDELPLLAQGATEFDGQVRFVGVLFADESPSAAIELAGTSGVTYPQVADPNSSLRAALGLRGLPTTVFLLDGEVVGAQLTPYRDYGDLVDDIAEHLEVSR